jgi:hypothetical protein
MAIKRKRRRQSLSNASSRKQQVFLSHSGKLSQDLANLFREFLRTVLSPLNPFLSTEGILLGCRWASVLREKLAEGTYGILFVTRENAYASNWMSYEAATIEAHDGNRVVPILIDILPDELPPIYRASQCMSFDEISCRRLIEQLNKECGFTESDVVDKHFKQEWPALKEKWEKTVEEDRERRRRIEQEELARSSVTFDDDKFCTWITLLHNVIHGIRDICIHLMHDHPQNNPVEGQVEDGFVPPSHPGMERFRMAIREILDDIRCLFERLPTTAGCRIRVCLRDLRQDGNFYTFARSVPDEVKNLYGDSHSRPIPKDCRAFKDLEMTWPKAKCVIETTPEEGWGLGQVTHPNDAFYGTKSVLIGSVIVKNIDKNDIVSNSYMIWAIFISADKEGVFKPYHRAILQTCNDAFSCMANLMLRMSHSRGAER